MGIAMLGPLAVNGEEGTLSHRDRVVLAALVARAGEVLDPEQLADALWSGGPPSTWSKVVQGCIVRLRKVLGADAIVTTDGGYRLSVSPDDIDVRRFERLLGRGRELLTLSEPDRAAYVLDEAMALWRGPALGELENWDPGRIEATRLHELRRDAEELRVEAALRSGRCREVLGEAQTLVAEAPMRERRWALLALAQYQAGQQGQALRTLRQVRAVLSTELGLDPGPDLIALEAGILRQDPALVVDVALPQLSATCPYPGLLPYDLPDRESFFGRDAEVAECRRRLATAGVLVVVGPSGCGKSSLIRAGVAAALEQEGRRVTTVTPGARPRDCLTALRESNDVLVVDQCENAVLLCEDPLERSAFFDALAERSERGAVLVALRADRMGEVTTNPRFARLVERGLFLLGPMGPEQLRSCIEGPARQAGLLLEPGLVDLLVREVEGEPGALPLLSHALRETWSAREGRTLTVAGYRATGGIRGAVARSAEEVYRRVSEDRRPLLRALLLRLVGTTPQGDAVRVRVARHLVTNDPAHAEVVELLVGARLVTTDDDTLEIAHEALVRAWPRLQEWLDEDVEGRRVLRHLADAAEAWEAMGRPVSELYRGIRLARAIDWRERSRPDLTPLEEDYLAASRAQTDAELQRARRQAEAEAVSRRRTRRLATGLAVALVLALVGAAIATRYQIAAERRAVEANRASTEADANRLAALSQSVGSLDLSLLLAAESARSALTPATTDALLDTLVEHRRAIQVAPLAGRPWDGELADGGRALYVSLTDRVLRWQAGTAAPVREFSDWFAPGDIATAARSDRMAMWTWKDDETLLLGVFDGFGRRQLGQVGLRQIGGWPLAVGLSPDGRRLLELVGVDDPHGPSFVGFVRVVDVATGDVLERIRAQRSALADVYLAGNVADDGSAAVNWTDEDAPEATLVDLRDGDAVRLQVPHRSAVSLGFVALRDGAAQRWSDGTVSLYDGRGRRIQDLDAHRTVVNDLAVSPDGTWAATGDNRGVLLVWSIDPVTGRWSQREALVGHAGGIRGLSVDPRGETLLSVSEDSTAISWDLSGGAGFGTPVPGLRHRWISNRPVTVTPGKLLVAPTRPAPRSPEKFGRHGSHTLGVSAAFIHPETGKVVDLVPVHRTVEDATFGSSVSVSPDGSKVAVTYATGTAVLDARSRQVLARIVLPPTGERAPDGSVRPELVWCSAWTPDGRRLLIGADGKGYDQTDGNLAVVDTRSWRLLPRRVRLDSTGAQTMEVSPDGRWLAVGMSNSVSSGNPQGTVDILDADTLTSVRRVRLGESNFPFDVSFSPDGRLVAAAGDHGFLTVFDRASGRLLHDPVKVHNQFAQQAEWTPDGSTVVTSGADGMVSLYDVRRGLVRASLPASAEAAAGYTYLLEVSRDGISALAGEHDGRRYSLERSRWLDYACVVVGRDLTSEEWSRYLPDRPYRRTCTDRPDPA